MYQIIITSKTVHDLKLQLKELASDINNTAVEVRETPITPDLTPEDVIQEEVQQELPETEEVVTQKKTRRSRKPKAVEAKEEVVETSVPPVPETISNPEAMIPEIPVIGEALPPSYDFENFKRNLVMIMTNLINQKKIDRDYVKSLADYFEVKNVWDIAKDELKCRQLFDQFAAYGFIIVVG